MRRFLLCLLLPLALAACGAEPKWAPDADVQRAYYHLPGPATITLFTAINNRSGEGAHSGLMISGGERILFDPAGTWWHQSVPERNDVHYGITPGIEQWYINYHARETFHVVKQEIVVSPEVAALAAQKAKAYGAVPKAMCANSVSTILGGLPGFEGLGHSYFPGRLMRKFGELPGVHEEYYFDNDNTNHSVMMTKAQAMRLPPYSDAR